MYIGVLYLNGKIMTTSQLKFLTEMLGKLGIVLGLETGHCYRGNIAIAQICQMVTKA